MPSQPITELTASNTHSWNPDKEATCMVRPNGYRERPQPVFSVLSNSPEDNVSEDPGYVSLSTI